MVNRVSLIPLPNSYNLLSAKATYAAIAETYSYLTPDLWKETVFTKSPYQVRRPLLHTSAMIKSQSV